MPSDGPASSDEDVQATEVTPPDDPDWRECLRCSAVLTVAACIFGAVVYLFVAGHVTALLVRIAAYPLWVCGLIIIGLIMAVCQPCGYGFTITIIASSFALGWVAFPFVYVGAQLGNGLAYWLTRRFVSDTDSITSKIQNTALKKWVSALLLGVADEKSGFFIIALARASPVTIGLQNALFAAAGVPFASRYVPATMLGSIPDCLFGCYTGVLLRQANDKTASGELDSTNIAILCVQVVALVVLMCLVSFAVNRSFQKLLPKVSGNEINIDDGEEAGHTN